ncbi:DUF6207 family protein [Streptomyces hirsutus]|uniref:DUF6207 family protein n=1 Tax=Streptomyces hirsutus TaxID=35620 RepID=UPI0036982B4B
MKPIRDEHLAESGLVVVDVAAADNDTAFAFQAALAGRWATATADRTARAPGEARRAAALLPGPAPGPHRRGRP